MMLPGNLKQVKDTNLSSSSSSSSSSSVLLVLGLLKQM
jgi:hypothetical protein